MHFGRQVPFRQDGLDEHCGQLIQRPVLRSPVPIPGNALRSLQTNHDLYSDLGLRWGRMFQTYCYKNNGCHLDLQVSRLI